MNHGVYVFLHYPIYLYVRSSSDASPLHLRLARFRRRTAPRCRTMYLLTKDQGLICVQNPESFCPWRLSRTPKYDTHVLRCWKFQTHQPADIRCDLNDSDFQAVGIQDLRFPEDVGMEMCEQKSR